LEEHDSDQEEIPDAVDATAIRTTHVADEDDNDESEHFEDDDVDVDAELELASISFTTIRQYFNGDITY
jgi:hypothetical protein